MYHTIGEKYEETKDLDIKEIAKLVRKDLKEEFKDRDFKFSVRIERFSMGQALNIEVDNTGVERHTATESDLRDHVRRVADRYNFDDSDSLSDYSHVRFYCHLRIES